MGSFGLRVYLNTHILEGYGLCGLRKKGNFEAKSPKDIPQGLKPALILQLFTALFGRLRAGFEVVP
jgi:hypothetical protein